MDPTDYSSKADHIRQLASIPPEKLVDHMTAAHQNVQSAAPNLAPHVHAAAMNAINYLNSKLPGAGGELAQDPHTEPSRAQKIQWLELHSVVNNPLTVLNHVDKGTLSHHHVEALKAVYPELHSEMAGKLGEHLGRLKMQGKELPYARKLQVSMLLGEPVDSTMTPQAMQAALMANHGAITKTQGGGTQKASGAELNQFNKVNEMAMTAGQKRQAGKG